MGEFIVEDVHWKKGEQGLQKFVLFESDGIDRRNGSGKSYKFAFWKRGAEVVKGEGALIAVDEVMGEYNYVVSMGDTDTVLDHYLGELIEDPDDTKLRSNSFKVIVEESSDL